jgi:hypothetical protein
VRKLEDDEGRELAGRVVIQALEDLTSSKDILLALDSFEWLLMGDGCLWAEALEAPPREPEDVLTIIGGRRWRCLVKK